MRFESFNDSEQGLMSIALFIAIEQWRKDIINVPSMKHTFEIQIERAEKLREEIGF